MPGVKIKVPFITADIYDTFSTDGAVISRVTEKGGKVWGVTLAAGATTVVNTAGGIIKAASGTGNAFAHLDVGQRKYTVTCLVGVAAANSVLGLIVGYVSPTSYYGIYLTAGGAQYGIYRMNGTQASVYASGILPKATDRLIVEVDGATLKLSLNDEVLTTITMDINLTSTKIAVRVNGSDPTSGFSDLGAYYR